MKKTIHDIFDEATSAEMDHLISKSDAPDVSKKIRARIKDKAYAKAGLAAPQKKNSVEVIGRYVAAAACLCMMIGVVLFAVNIFNFDGVSPKENTEQDKELSQGGGSEENDGGQQGGPSDGNVETVTKGMNISQNSSLFPLFEKNCFYAYDDENNFYRILWSDFTGLSEKDRIIVEYRDLKKIVYSEYDVIYEVTAVRVERVSDEFYSPFNLTCKVFNFIRSIARC